MHQYKYSDTLRTISNFLAEAKESPEIGKLENIIYLMKKADKAGNKVAYNVFLNAVLSFNNEARYSKLIKTGTDELRAGNALPESREELVQEARPEVGPGTSVIVKDIQSNSEWRAMRDKIRTIKGGIEVIDSFYYDGKKALNNLIVDWTSKKGVYAKHFLDIYGVVFSVESQEIIDKPRGWYAKAISNNKDIGVVSITLKIK